MCRFCTGAKVIFERDLLFVANWGQRYVQPSSNLSQMAVDSLIIQVFGANTKK